MANSKVGGALHQILLKSKLSNQNLIECQNILPRVLIHAIREQVDCLEQLSTLYGQKYSSSW